MDLQDNFKNLNKKGTRKSALVHIAKWVVSVGKGNNLLTSPEKKGILLWHSWGHRKGNNCDPKSYSGSSSQFKISSFHSYLLSSVGFATGAFHKPVSSSSVQLECGFGGMNASNSVL